MPPKASTSSWAPRAAMSKKSVPAAAFRASIPVLFSYLFGGAVFGILFNTLGYPWPYAVLSGVVVFAGAAQYLSVGLLAAHASLTAVFMATLFINLRHMFYGFSFLRRFPDRGWRRYYLIFTLTDETYALLAASRLETRIDDERYCLWTAGLNHLYWVTGCAIGAVLSHHVRFESRGLEFVMTALFVVLAVEQALSVRRAFPFLIAAGAAALSLSVAPKQMLVTSLAVVFLALLWKSKEIPADE